MSLNLLGIDTATEACTVALQTGDRRVESVVPERQHAERLLGEIDALLSANGVTLAEIDAIAWGRGPGMFTGLRIGAGVVQGIAYAIDKPVVPVSTLAVIAAGQPQQKILAAIDARMGQVYWAAYENTGDGIVALTGESVSDPSMVGEGLGGGFTGAGSGWDQYGDDLMQACHECVTGWTPGQVPRGDALLALGEAGYAAGLAVPAMEAVPVYVRDKVARKTAER